MKIVFLDRDGTLILEPADFRVDTLEKLTLVPEVVPALQQLQSAGYKFVMVSNQDGLGTDDWREEDFWPPHNALLEQLAKADILFEAVFIDRHMPADNHPNRKPGTGMLRGFLTQHQVELNKSWMVGDRNSDALFAQNLGVQSVTINHPDSADGNARQPNLPEAPTARFTNWPAIVKHILAHTK